MIGALRGRVTELVEEVIVLDVRGVGYELTVTASVLERLGRPVSTGGTGDEIALVVFTDVKESSITLYGFSDRIEREIFLLLRRVKGIGSRLALNIVSTIGSSGVLRAIGDHDVATLKLVPGIGGKTAERIVLELREQVENFVPARDGRALPPLQISRTRAPGPDVNSAEGDVILALERLGFSRERASAAVCSSLEQIGQAGKALESGELLRITLGSLA